MVSDARRWDWRGWWNVNHFFGLGGYDPTAVPGSNTLYLDGRVEWVSGDDSTIFLIEGANVYYY